MEIDEWDTPGIISLMHNDVPKLNEREDGHHLENKDEEWGLGKSR